MLRFDKGRLDLDDLKMQIARGAASGHATLRRDGDTATLTGSADRRLGRGRTAGILGPRRGRARLRLDRAQPRGADRGARRRRDGELRRRGAGAKRSCRSRSRRRQGAGPRRAARRDQHRLRLRQRAQPGAAADSGRVGADRAQRGRHEDRPDQDSRAARRRRAERRPRSAQARRRDAPHARLVGQRLEVLVGTAAERDGRGRQRSWRRRSGSSTSALFPPGSRRRRSRARPTASPRWKPTFANALSSTGVSRASGSWIAGGRKSRTSKSSRRG